jgi:hypothetical protein
MPTDEPADDGRRRSPRQVVDAHLARAREGRVDDDLAENYAADVVVLGRFGTERGHDGVRRLADRLDRELPGATFSYDAVEVAGRVGFLAWSARADDGTEVRDGADSFLVEDGRIVAQTIHYAVVRPGGS